MAKTHELFGDFQPVTAKDWEEKIKVDLKGASYERLFWKNLEGPLIKPFYTPEDLERLAYLEEFPRIFTGSNDHMDTASWNIREDIDAGDPVEANKKALNALNKGASSLAFIISGDKKPDKNFVAALLEGIFVDCIEINFITTAHQEEFYRLFTAYLDENGIDPSKINGSTGIDPLIQLSINGNLPSPPAEELKKMVAFAGEVSSKTPGMRSCNIYGKYFRQAGGSIVQELAFTLALVSEYMEAMTASGMSVDQAAGSIKLNLSAGPVFFMEIAKFRALRLLFSRLIKAWGAKNEVSYTCPLHVETSFWHQTVYDPYVNILRGTTSAMSAILGGTDSLRVLPFDSAFRKTTDFSERIARNIQIILKEESYLDKVADVSSGSYYIESLTDGIAEQAWDLFLETEETGGFLEALKKSFIQKKIAATASARDVNIAYGKQVLLGINRFPDATEKLSKDFDEYKAFPENLSVIDKKEVERLILYRGSMIFEELRIRTEKTKHAPRVFLLTYGDPVMRKARAGFAAGFFAAAGYEIIDNPGFRSVEEGMKAAKAAKADIVVLCSSDVDYPDTAARVLEKAPENMIPVIAGYPVKYVEQLRESGFRHFIHMKSNMLEELRKFHEILEIR